MVTGRSGPGKWGPGESIVGNQSHYFITGIVARKMLRMTDLEAMPYS